jgi:hypothetical protein
MAYDAAKDQVLETWENEETGLIISINRYGEGDPKLQIGPRAYTKRDGSKGTTRAGRLTVDDLLWFSEILEEVKARMNDHFMEG